MRSLINALQWFIGGGGMATKELTMYYLSWHVACLV